MAAQLNAPFNPGGGRSAELVLTEKLVGKRGMVTNQHGRNDDKRSLSRHEWLNCLVRAHPSAGLTATRAQGTRCRQHFLYMLSACTRLIVAYAHALCVHDCVRAWRQVRIAVMRFVLTGEEADVSKALERLFNERIAPSVDGFMQRDHQIFRREVRGWAETVGCLRVACARGGDTYPYTIAAAARPPQE